MKVEGEVFIIRVTIFFLDKTAITLSKELIKDYEELIIWLEGNSDAPFKIISITADKPNILLFKHAIKNAFISESASANTNSHVQSNEGQYMTW